MFLKNSILVHRMRGGVPALIEHPATRFSFVGGVLQVVTCSINAGTCPVNFKSYCSVVAHTEITPSHNNNLTALRWLAAMLVLYGYSFIFLGPPEPVFMQWKPLGPLGVFIFFAISGYLVAQSWARDPHVLRFLVRRVLRIFSGLGNLYRVVGRCAGTSIDQFAPG